MKKSRTLPKPLAFVFGCILFFLSANVAVAQNFRSASSNGAAAGVLSLTISKPAGTASGDVMIAAIAFTPSSASITAPAGWMLVRRTDQTSTTSNAQAIYWKAASSSDPASFTWTFSGSSGSAGGIASFYNVNAVSPINVHAGQANASSLTQAAPGVTTTVNNTMLVNVHSFSSIAAWTPSTGMTKAFEKGSSSAPSADGISLAMNYLKLAASGATGAKSATASAYADAGVGQTIALNSCSTPAAPSVVSPVFYCLNATASSLSATGSNLIWGDGGIYSGTAGGPFGVTSVTFIDGQYGPSTAYTSFTTNAPDVTLTSVDYIVPAWQSVNGLVLSLYNSSGTLLATSSTKTTFNNGSASPVTITNLFNYTLAAAGTYFIKASAGYGNIGGDQPSLPITEPSGNMAITGYAGGGYRIFNNIRFGVVLNSVAPTPSTAAAGTTNYAVTQTVNGCISPAATIAVSVNTPPVLSQIPSAGKLSQYMFNGNAADMSGYGNNGTLQGGPTAVADRHGKAASAYSFNGSTQYVSTTYSSVAPNDFSMALWFKTTTTTGGKLAGIENSQTGSSSSYDRHIYMSNSGQLYFGVYPGAIKVINTTESYNDGAWHHVVASLSTTAGMKLYVDGVLKKADAAVLSGHPYTAFFRMGYGNLGSWTNAPSSLYFNGVLDDVLVYDHELTATEVNTLYTNADGASSNAPVCYGSTVNLAATAIAGASYSWTGPNGFTSSLRTPSIANVSAVNAGTYTVTASTAGCSSVSAAVLVSLRPAASAAISYAGSPFCAGSGTAAVTLTGTTGGTFSSTAGLSLNSATGAINLGASTPGTYTVTYTAGAAGSCPTIATTTVTINRVPSVSGTATLTCVGGSTGSITALGSGGNTPYTYSINGGAYQSSTTFTGLAAGNYTLNIQSSTGCINSTTVPVSAYPESTDDPMTAGSDAWIGHVYDGTAFQTYVGQVTEAETFTQSFGGNTTCYEVTSGGSSRSIYTETFSVKYRMNSTRSGLYVVNLGSDDGSRLTVNGTLVYNNWSDQGFSTKSSVLVSLSGNSSLLYEYYENGGGNQVAFQNLTPVLANTLTTNTSQTICLGGTGASISGDAYGTLPSGISLSGTGYQWSYSTTPGGSRTDIAGATGAAFMPSSLVAPFNVPGTYYVYRKAVLSSANNVSPNPFVATHESNVATIIITPPVSASIAYGGSPYCSLVGAATVSFSGTTGGTYSSTAGLSINAATGAVNLAASTAGTYTVTYAGTSAGGCPFAATATIQLSPLANNQINFINGVTGVICATPSEGATATLTAPSGTVFTTVNFASFGTPEGTCQAFTEGACHSANSQTVAESYLLGYNTAGVPATNAVFTDPCVGTVKRLYVQATYTQPVCSGTLPGTITGSVPTGGNGSFSYFWEKSTTSATTGFSAAPGVNNAKDYTPGVLTQTTWFRRTVTSTGCSVSKVIQITVKPAPNATIFYDGSPYCSSAGTATVTQTGTAGGTYSSLSGLSLDSSTGTIDIGASLPGTYTVTYTVVAPGSCSAFTTTTRVIIQAVPAVTNATTATICSGTGTNLALTSSTPANFSWTVGKITGGITGASAGSGNAINQTLTNPGATAGTVEYVVTPTAKITAYGGAVTTGSQVYGERLGMVFTVNKPVQITSLGVFDDGSDGIAGTLQVGIVRNADGVTVAGPVSITGSTDRLIENHRMRSINAVTLLPGMYTVVAVGFNASDKNANITFGNAGTVMNTGGGVLTFNSSSYGGAGFGLPTTPYAVPNTFHAGTFEFNTDCAGAAKTLTVTVAPTPSATIRYAGTPYCSSAGTAAVTQTGTSGGTYSSTAGLSINAATGAVNLAASTAGTYTVTYTLAATGTCPAYTTTTTLTITTQPFTDGYFAGNPYCSGGGLVYPTVTQLQGATGSVSFSPAGLAMDGTGGVNLNASTPGTYTITYTVPAQGGCALYSKSTTITINPAPSATITYGSSAYCTSTATATVTQTGTAGGTYAASPAGLTIDASTGTIRPETSTPGTYAITYTIAPSGTCGAYVASTTVTVFELPSATIAYPALSLCGSDTAAVTLTGTGGGVFSSSPAGLGLDASTGTINPLAGKAGSYTVFYTVAASAACPQFQTSTPVTVNVNVWSGRINTDWTAANNWSCGAPPTGSDDVLIPSGLTNYPVIKSKKTGTVNNLIIQAGAQVTVTSGTLNLAGAVSNQGILDVSSGATVLLSGTDPQVLPSGVFLNNTVYNLTISNPASVTLNGSVDVLNLLALNAGTLYTNDFLTLKSSVDSTARVEKVNSTAAEPIVGDVTVERYVGGRRKYRLMTPAVTSSSKASLDPGEESRSIWANWQNSGVALSGVGTFITGGTAADGFDTQTSNPSLFTYSDTSRKFIAFSSASGKKTKYTPLQAGRAYYMFVYGDRLNTISTPAPNPTVLKSKGALVTGPQTFNTASEVPLTSVIGNYTLIGNPYASTIDWKKIQKTRVSPTMWGWDPNLSSTGGYVTVTANASGVVVAPVSSLVQVGRYIQPGQGFFVQTTGANPQLVIDENHKVNNSASLNNNVFRGADETTPSLLAINLLYTSAGTTVLADGAVAAFDPAFLKEVNEEDGLKMTNSAEGLSLAEGGTLLGINSRPWPQNNDTLYINLARLSKAQYTLEVFGQEMGASSAKAFLEDTYLNTATALSLVDTNRIVFSVVGAEPASFAAGRFRIVFRQASVPPVRVTEVTATKKDAGVLVKWTVASEVAVAHYAVEHSTDSINFSTAAEVPARNTGTGTYQWLQVNPAAGKNWYRIRAVEANGRSFTTDAVMVAFGAGQKSVTVGPNPVVHQKINLQVTGLDAGSLTAQLFDRNGREVLRQVLLYGGGTGMYVLQPAVALARGLYVLKLSARQEHFEIKILIE